MVIGFVFGALALLCVLVAGRFLCKNDSVGYFGFLAVGVLLLFVSAIMYKTFWQGKIAKEICIAEGMMHETVKSTEVEGKIIAFIRNRKAGELFVYEFAKEPPKFFVKTNDKENPYLAVQP